MAGKCLLCGKEIEEENFRVDPYDEDEVEKKSPSFCQRCLSKVKHESSEGQKTAKM